MNERILVVDDDDDLRHALVATLKRAGYSTEEATNGLEALDRYRAAPADLVLTDVYMPGTDGVEAIIRLRAEFPGARVVVMSGGGYMAAEGVLDVATRLGAQATLEKPVASQVLLQTVADVLEPSVPLRDQPPLPRK